MSKKLNTSDKFCYKRLAGELAKLKKEDLDGIDINPTDSMLIWMANIKGPPNTPYEKGSWNLVIRFSEDYPIKAPSVKFLENIYHPNIYKDGKICVDILQSNWSPAMSIEKVLYSIRSLLMDPNPSSPANREAAQLFVNNYENYCLKVKESLNKK